MGRRLGSNSGAVRSPDGAAAESGYRLAGGHVDPDCAPLALHPGYGLLGQPAKEWLMPQGAVAENRLMPAGIRTPASLR
jgi:hypothetical protein